MSESKQESRLEKVVFEIGRGLLFGGLAATIFRQEIPRIYPVGALLLGILFLAFYVWKEDRK